MATCVMLFAAACSGAPPFGETIPEELTCTSADLGGGYLMKTAGEFSTHNLADLSDDAPKRKAALESAGLRGGRFNYWKQAPGRPPFDPPIDAVCQAMEFGTPDQAAQFVRDLRPEPGDLATSTITWLPGSGRKAEELTAPGGTLPPGARAFRLEAGTSPDRVALYAVAAPQGRFVQSVYVGSAGGAATLEVAETVLARLVQRSAAADR